VKSVSGKGVKTLISEPIAKLLRRSVTDVGALLMSENDDSSVDVSDFPSLEEILTEARRRYDNEEQRRDGIENKVGIVVTANVLLISLGSYYITKLISAVALLPALLSALLGIYVVRPSGYKNPLKPAEEYYSYASEDPDAFHDRLLLSYISAIRFNSHLNQIKVHLLNICTALTFVSLVLIVLSPAIDFGIVLELLVAVSPLLITPSLLTQARLSAKTVSDAFQTETVS